jgi:phosphoketolase
MSEATSNGILSPNVLVKMNAYWRAANYLSVGQIYLKDNPLLERPLTLETLAAVVLLRTLALDLIIRVVNVVDLMALPPPSEHTHGLPDEDYDQIFPPKTPTVFVFHGYPWLIHRLTYRRHNHDNLHVRGYKEEGTTTTPFDMCVSTISTASSWRLTRSSACRGSADRRTPPSSGTPRPSSATSSTWRKTATICRRFATGAGRKADRSTHWVPQVRIFGPGNPQTLGAPSSPRSCFCG